jgi:hypothetical protein
MMRSAAFEIMRVWKIYTAKESVQMSHRILQFICLEFRCGCDCAKISEICSELTLLRAKGDAALSAGGYLKSC